MRRSFIGVGAALLLFVLLAGGAQAIEIFVWQHDNDLRVADPVLRASLTATEAVTRTLDQLDIDYTLNRNLPDSDSLGYYDVVITCLSFFCPG